ncbi:hypothetical protein [Rheinheimera salexigens]|uniref:Uncharacterized protein n=1 Tax=Rheinheimera salexigens TaxID=1628148 RepID=A0A1E7Q5Z9_9GAMM|nr:hypothetical protein [Rheinheimera salexigens]OEY69604.1 hypothetical protein BI198_08555 [Rheinheimera salexigens]
MELHTLAKKQSDRRSGPDLVCRLFTLLAIAGWLLFVVCLVITHYASPEMDSGLVRYWHIDIRTYWRPTLTAWLEWLLWGCVLLSGISFVLHWFRLKRRSDHLHLNIVLLFVTSVGFLLYIARQ